MENTLLGDIWHRFRATDRKGKSYLILKYICIAWIIVMIWIMYDLLVMRGKIFYTFYCSAVFINIRISLSNWEGGKKKQFRACQAPEFCKESQRQRPLGKSVSRDLEFLFPSRSFLSPFSTSFYNFYLHGLLLLPNQTKQTTTKKKTLSNFLYLEEWLIASWGLIHVVIFHTLHGIHALG